jgi:hypothetical protein
LTKWFAACAYAKQVELWSGVSLLVSRMSQSKKAVAEEVSALLMFQPVSQKFIPTTIHAVVVLYCCSNLSV